MLVNSGNDNDNVVTRLSWNEQIELEDSEEDLNNSTLDRPGMTKFLTQLHKLMEHFLHKAPLVSNSERRQF